MRAAVAKGECSMIMRQLMRPAASRSDWPPSEIFRMPPELLSGVNLSYLAFFRPTPKPFYLFASAHFPPGSPPRMHSHPCVSMHGCLQGPMTLVTEAGEHLLDAGMFCWLGPGVQHGWRNLGRQTAASISFQVDTEKPGAWPSGTGIQDCCRALRRLVTGVHRFNVTGDQELQHTFWQMADHLMEERSCPRLVTTGLLCLFTSLVLERL